MSHQPPTTLPPPVFTDTADPPRKWMFRVTLAHIRDIQAQYPDFRLERIIIQGSPEFMRLSSDTVLLADVMEVLLRSQLAERGISFVELLEAFQGETADQAVMALVSAVANFCPSRTARQQALRILATFSAMERFDREVAQAMESGLSSGHSPPVPESSPGNIPCENSAITPTPPPAGDCSPPELIPTSPPLTEQFPLDPSTP